MNKTCHRIIFNKARGLLMVVAETCLSQGKASGETAAPSKNNERSLIAAIKPLTFFVSGLFGMMTLPAAHAQIVADPTAAANQRPTVLSAPNNVPLVNIQTPSAAGVSRNTYRQFDVQQQGAILNNSRTNVQTQLGGWVQGNPWLATGSARVILNEVNSSNPSLLKGTVEVAGQRAQVVIANPSGVTCDGCGFINANRATITTGTPIMNSGSLDGFRVQGGMVTITGNGMDASAADYTDIIARAVQINAGIWANQLNVVTGTNRVCIDQTTNDPSVSGTTTGTGATPAFAIDTGQLGGMYAGKITLLATESGVGVRNAGKLYASVGDVLITANGQLQNTGQIIARQKTDIQSPDTLTNRGLIDGGQTHIQVRALQNLGAGALYGDHLALESATLDNLPENAASPVIAARQRLDIGAAQVNNREHALIYSDGDLSIGGGLDAGLHATGRAVVLNNDSATIDASGSAEISVRTLNNTNQHFSTTTVHLPAQSIVEYQGSGAPNRYTPGAPDVYVYNNESDHLHTPEGNYESWLAYNYTRQTSETRVASTDPALISTGGALRITADTVNNDKSHIIAGGTLTGNIGALNNTEVAGERVITDSGSVTSYWRDHHKGRDSTGSSSTAYTPAPTIQSISLTPTVYQQNAAANNAPHPVPDIISRGGLNLNNLFRLAPTPAATYLIETDPRFTNYRTWLSSDYLLKALSYDPALVQKRLGDGFYEQRLLREQIVQLTGRRFLEGHASDEAQYAALMDAGITYAQAHQLTPGVALSAAQMAQLTSDIVWLVEKDITLPDGTTQKALVPQLYVRVQEGDLQAGGALIAGHDVKLTLTGDLLNRGVIAGRHVVALSAENINNLGGRILGTDVGVAARTDLNNIGGTIAANNNLVASAGRDLNVVSDTRTQINAQGHQTHIDRVAGLYVTGSTGTLLASAGHDTNLIAAAIQNQGTGDTRITANNNVNLGAVTQNSSNRIVWNGNNKRSDASKVDIGTSVQTQGNLTFAAGNDLNAKAAQVTSSQGNLLATAGNNVNLTAGEANVQVDEAHQHKGRSSAFSRKTTTTRDMLDQTTAQASTFSGQTTTVLAGQDINLTGSNVVSDHGTALSAQNNLNIAAATNTAVENHFRKEKKSGLFSGGGIGVTLGTQQQSTEQKAVTKTAAASTVGSTQGDIDLHAGKRYAQTGSDVVALQGDIHIGAQQVDINEARETRHNQIESQFKQSGLTLAITSPVISAIQTAQQMSQAASDTSDPRMKALAAANIAFAGKNAVDAIKTGQGATINDKDNQIPTGKTNPDGTAETRDANAADKAGGVNLSISIGGSKRTSKTVQTSDAARGSTVAAGGDIHITASGAAQDSDITVQGSTLQAGNRLVLNAEDEIRLLAAKNTADQHSTNKSRSGSIGISIGTDGFLLTVGASGARGKADGSDVTWANTQVNAGHQVALNSGGDTTLKGAVAQAPQITANIGGDLAIESLQDTSQFDSKQKSLGGSISIGYGKVGGSLSASQSKIKSDYASVTEQPGFRAGDEGFNINVAKNTDLKGGAITSTQKAIDNSKNNFRTGGELTTRDIQNHASYQASSAGVNVGAGVSLDGKLAPQGTGAGLGRDSGNADSTTQAAISGVAGNTAARTGDAETGIGKIFDADKVQKDINAQVMITQKFNELAPKAAADYASKQVVSLKKQAETATDPEKQQALLDEAKKWAPNGSYNIAMNIIIGAAGGNLNSAVTKETLSWAANEMRQNMIEDSKKFKGLCDTQGNCISNQSGKSVGVNGDEFKLAGGRIVLAAWCAEGRCEKDDSTQTGYAENPDGTVKLTPKDKEGNEITLTQFVEQNPTWRSELGGHQGGKGQIALPGIQFDYEKESFWDKLAEAYSGTHDMLNSPIWYDKNGNSKKLDGRLIGNIGEVTNMTNVLVATPFALSVLLPPEVWNTINILVNMR